MTSAPPQPSAAGPGRLGALYGGVFFIAMSVLLFEITLTRVFAVLMWHHFAYMVVSLALLGLGASGSLLTLKRVAEHREVLWPRLALYASASGIAAILCFLLATRIPIDSLAIWKHPANFLGLFASFALISVPFLFAGLAIGASLSWRPEHIGRLYFFDLLGSAIGGISAPWLLGGLETPAVVVVAALLALLSGAIFSLQAPPARRLAHTLLLVGGLSLLIGFTGGGLGIPPLAWQIPFAPHKTWAERFFRGGQPATTLPSATAQVDISAPLRLPMLIGGEFGALGRRAVRLRGVTQDGTAPTALYEGAREVQRYDALDDTQAATAFIAHRARGGGNPTVLVIGVGGGIDVMMALYFDAAQVTAVEINQAMVRMVTEDFADYIGHLFDDPRVRLITEDGRAYLQHADRRFDIIQLSGVDTYTALSTGAYTLSESYLYTVEAVMDMVERLNEGGYINYSRLILTAPPRRPRETLRLANIARTALERLGVPEPSRSIAVFQGDRWASTIIRKGPFTSQEIDALRSFGAREKFLGLVFDPLRPRGGPYDPAEDYFSEVLARRRRPGQGQAGLDDREALALRVKEYSNHRVQIQEIYDRVLKGEEAEREEFIAGYFFDIRPAWDDKPFFFDYFKLARLLEASRDVGWGGPLQEFPVGHAVLLTSLLQIALLAVVLILLPLRPLARRGYRLPGKMRFFVYFAGLGCGFMFVEISLMQKFILFLGHPTYSLSVVLSSILAFAGLGALASSRVRRLSRRSLVLLLAAVVGWILLNVLFLDRILDAAVGLDLTHRVALSVIVLAPTAFSLGFPFPMGIRLLESSSPVLIPWGWAVNGFLSVTGSLVAILLAMAYGFTTVLLLAGALYATALLIVPVSEARAG